MPTNLVIKSRKKGTGRTVIKKRTVGLKSTVKPVIASSNTVIQKQPVANPKTTTKKVVKNIVAPSQKNNMVEAVIKPRKKTTKTTPSKLNKAKSVTDGYVEGLLTKDMSETDAIAYVVQIKEVNKFFKKKLKAAIKGDDREAVNAKVITLLKK